MEPGPGEPQADTVQLTCNCGSVKASLLEVSPRNTTRIVCMCDDCQAYAHYLRPDKPFLDASGGTEVVQSVPARLRIDGGHAHLRCLRLTPKGLMRWYAACCRTPLANHLPWAGLPFVGVHLAAVAPEVDRDRALGPLHCRVQGRFGVAPLPAGSYQRAPLSVIARSLRLLGRAYLAGAAKPHPFYDAQTGAPIAPPHSLDPREREGLRTLCGPRPATQ